MKRFKAIKDGKVRSEWTSDFADKNYYEENWGKPERWVRDASDAEKAQALETRTVDILGKQVTEYKLAAEFTITEEDMTAEIAAATADKADRDQAKAFLKGLKKSDLTDVDKCATAIMRIVKHLRADQ